MTSTDQLTEVLSTQLLFALRAEATRAHLKHSSPVHGGGSLLDPTLSDQKRLAALMEEVGEVARVLTYDGMRDQTVGNRDSHLLTELVQVANVAMTWAEMLRRIGTSFEPTLAR